MSFPFVPVVEPSYAVRRAYAGIMRRIRASTALARAFGSAEVSGVPVDPYPDYERMLDAASRALWCGVPFFVNDTNHNHPIWTDNENLAFRAHHDAMHVLIRKDFTLDGETAVWLATCADLGYRNLLNMGPRVLFCEIVGQKIYNEETGLFPVDANDMQIVYDPSTDAIAEAIRARFVPIGDCYVP